MLRTGKNVILRQTDGARNVVCRADGDIAHLRALCKRHKPGDSLGKRAVAAQNEQIRKRAGILRDKLGRVAAALGEKQAHGVPCVRQQPQRIRQRPFEAALACGRIYYHH